MSKDGDIKAAVFQRLHPRLYLERFIAENVRPDGREFMAWREVSINVGSITTADGSALVRMGDTTIVCGIKAEIAEPDLDFPDEGFFVLNVDLPAICSPKFKPGPPGEEAQVLSQRLHDLIINSGTISAKSLCIHPGKSAWVLYADATCVNYDGNAFDASLLAVVAALKNTRLPQAIFQEETCKTVCTRVQKLPLTLGCQPVSMSFGVFDGEYILADPTTFEEPLLNATITVALDQNGEVIGSTQIGTGAASEKTLLQCIQSAKRRHDELKTLEQ